MKTLKLFFAVIALSLICSSASARDYNKYGMELKKDDSGAYYISGAKNYKKYIGDPTVLPEALEPYKVKITAYDKPSTKSVVPDTIVFKKNKADQDLTLLVYKSQTEKAPVVFFIHGGGWVSGNNKGNGKLCKTLAGKYGITVVSVEYTFATVPGAKMEDAIQDCYDAVDYVCAKADVFNIDPKRIGFFGGSAGGHLSACCALKYKQTKAYAGWYGAYDLEYTMGIYAPEKNAKKHAKYTEYLNNWDTEYIKSCSPVEIANGMKKVNFQTILFVGTADITVGPENAERFKAALNKAGNKNVEIVTYDYVTHSITSSYAADDMYLKTIELFSSAL